LKIRKRGRGIVEEGKIKKKVTEKVGKRRKD
jgi:hypothetical protein